MRGTAAVARHARPGAEFLLVAAFLVLCVSQLFLGTPVGLADNGDFDRMLDWFGLRHGAEEYADRFFSYVDPQYVDNPDRGAFQVGFVSSAVIPLALGRGLSALFSDVPLHLHWIGGVYLVAYTAAFAALVRWTRPWKPVRRWVFLVLLVVLLTDIALVAWFNSVYSEPTALVALVWCVALAVRWGRSGHRDLWPGLALVASLLVLVTAKPQYITVALVMAGVLPLVAVGRRMLFAGLGAVLVATGLLCTIFFPSSFQVDTTYQTVFTGLVPSAEDPVPAVLELGLTADWARFSGTSAYGETSGLADPSRRALFAATVTKSDVVSYYLHHPAVAARTLLRGVGLLDENRPFLGNYQKEAGLPPRAEAPSLLGYSELRQKVLVQLPPWVVLLVIFGGLLGSLALSVRRRRLGLEVWVAAALSIALAQIGTVLVANGDVDVVKQSFLAQVLLDVSLIAAVTAVAASASLLARPARRSLLAGSRGREAGGES